MGVKRREAEVVMEYAMATLIVDHAAWMIRHLAEHGPRDPRGLVQTVLVQSELREMRLNLLRMRAK